MESELLWDENFWDIPGTLKQKHSRTNLNVIYSQLVYIRNPVVKSRVFACMQLECVSSLAKSYRSAHLGTVVSTEKAQETVVAGGGQNGAEWSKGNKLHSSPHALFTLYAGSTIGWLGACERVACTKRSMQYVFFTTIDFVVLWVLWLSQAL